MIAVNRETTIQQQLGRAVNLLFREEGGYPRWFKSNAGMMWEKASTGDTSMLIWLGKILCGQRDTSVVAVTGPNGGPVQSERVMVPVTDPIEAARVYQKLMSGD
jgi:hypothetical protein